jgi:hypothetical protein
MNKGRVSYLKTARVQPITFVKRCKALGYERYDLVISDFWTGYRLNAQTSEKPVFRNRASNMPKS